MAVIKASSVQHYVGLAADTKPTTSEVKAGSRFWETDTGFWFQYDGSAWTAEIVSFQGSVAHGAPDTGNPVKIGGKATADISAEINVDADDRVDIAVTRKGVVFIAGGAILGNGVSGLTSIIAEDGTEYPQDVGIRGRAPDTNWDFLSTANDANPGLGALNVALIGGDQALRASAAIGEASGQSTALDNMGWVRSFLARLDVTAAPSGGSPTLDVFIQTQLPSGDWQDVAAFTRATGVTAENCSWGPWTGELSQIVAEAASGFAVDQFFADQDVGMGAATVRAMVLGDSLRVKWVFAAGGSTGDFTFTLDFTPKS